MAPITHIVLFKYSPSIPHTTFTSHMRSFLTLPTRCLKPPVTGKPYMLSMRAGANRSWEPYNKGLTHGFVLEFATQEDLDYYLTADPVHAAFSAAAGPLVEDSVVLDICDGELNVLDLPRKPGTRDGACHCGAVRFEVVFPVGQPVGANPGHVLCHCRTCRLLGGGPYSCNQIVGKDDLKIVEGELSKYIYTGASGKPVDCYFCGRCTSHVYHEQGALPGKVIVRTLLLEDGEGWGVGGEIFAEGRLKWVGDLEGVLPTAVPSETTKEKSAGKGGHVNGVNGHDDN